MREFFRMLMERAAALFRRRRLEDDLDEELRSHLEMAIELNVRRGMSAAEASREALRNFGGVEQTKEMCRDQGGLPMIETAWQDLRFGLRIPPRGAAFFFFAHSLPYARHRRQRRRVQLGRRHSSPSLSARFPPGAPGRTGRNDG